MAPKANPKGKRARTVQEAPTCPYLKEWGDDARRVIGSRGFAAPTSIKVGEAHPKSFSDTVTFPPEVQLGKVKFHRSGLASRDPCVISDALHNIASDNPHVAVFQFTLTDTDTHILDRALLTRQPPKSNHTQTYNIGNRNHQDSVEPVVPMFSAQIPPPNLQAAHGYFSHRHQRRFFNTPDPHTILPVYSLPSASHLEWEGECHGLTTPTSYNADLVIPLPLQSPTPLIGPNDPIIKWDNVYEANSDLSRLPTLGYAHISAAISPAKLDAIAGEVGVVREWEAIFNRQAPIPSPYRDDGSNRVMAAAMAPDAPPSALADNAQDLPELQQLARHILQELQAATNLSLGICALSYIRASGEVHQAWHRDLFPAARPPDGMAFSAFLLLSDWAEADASRFVPGSLEGVPIPWKPVAMTGAPRDLWVIRSEMIHSGGIPALGARPRDVVFVGLATWALDFGFPVAVRIPPQTAAIDAPASSDTSCDAEGCTAQAGPAIAHMCVSCSAPLCPTHSVDPGLCRACIPGAPPTPDVVPQPAEAAPSQSLVMPCAMDCWFPSSGTGMYTVHLLDTAPCAPPMRPANPEDPCEPSACPFGLFLHEEEYLPEADPLKNLVIHTPPGTILGVRAGQYGGGLFRLPDAAAGVGACGFWWSIAGLAPPMDPSYLMEAGAIVRLPANGELCCTCHQVPHCNLTLLHTLHTTLHSILHLTLLHTLHTTLHSILHLTLFHNKPLPLKFLRPLLVWCLKGGWFGARKEVQEVQ